MFDNYLKITCIKYVLHNNYSYLERSRNDTRLNKALDADRWIGFSLNYGIIDSTDICRPFCQIMLASQVSIINYARNSSSCNWAIWKILSGLSSYINEQFISFVISCLFLLSFFAWNCISFYFIISNEHYVRRTFKNMVESRKFENL